MKKIFLFITLYIYIYCSLSCESEQVTDISPDGCHKLSVEPDQYCCYFEGKNLDTNKDEKFCWAFKKVQIDDDKVKETIETIEKGTDYHVTKKHSNVELDCFSTFEKINFALIGLALLF